MEHSGKIAFVTGGSRGIGKEIAVALARAGADIALADIMESEARDTAAEIEAIGVRAVGYGCDVSSFADVERVGKAFVDDFGRVDFRRLKLEIAGFTGNKKALLEGSAFICQTMLYDYICIFV